MKQLFTLPYVRVRFLAALTLGLYLTGSSELQAQTINATQTDMIFVDPNGNGKADPGDQIRYKVTIQNTAGPAGTNVQLNAVPDPRTSLAGNFRSSPLAVPDMYDVTGNVGLIVSAALGLKANDFDDNLGGATTTGAAVTDQGGSIMLNTDGSFMYSPPPGFTGTDTYTYTLNDITLVAGAPTTDAAVVTFNVTNLIWFIDNASVAATSDGRVTSPFKTIADFNAGSAAAAAVIYIEHNAVPGNYTGSGIILQNGERLFGEGHTGTAAPGENLSSVLPFALAPNSKPLPNIDGTRPVITTGAGDGVTLAMDNTLRGFNVGAASDFGIENTLATSVGNLIVSEVDINNTTGGGFKALNGSGASTSAVFGSISSNGNTNGISLTNFVGTFTAAGGTITNPTSAGVLIMNGTVTFSYGGAITTNSGLAVNIDNHDSGNATFSGNITSTGMGIVVQNSGGGTKTFSGANHNLNTGANTAVNLANNAGAIIDFTGGDLDITTTTGTGFTATVGGTVTVTGGSNTITKSGNGAALNIANVNAGAGAITFNSINVTGGTGTAVSITMSTGTKNLGDVDVARSGGAGGTGILAASAGTLNTTDGTINSGPLVAIDIDIAVLGVVLTSVSANGAANGIDVSNTTGSFTINGTGTTDGTGGTIQNITNRGASFVTATNITLKNIIFTNANTANGGGTCNAGTLTGCNGALYMSAVTTLVLTNMDVNTTAQEGLNGINVTTMTLSNSSFTNCGDAQFEGCVRIQNLQGTCSISNSTFVDPADRGVEIINTAAATPLTLTVTGSTFSDNFDNADGEQGLFVQTAAGTNTATVSNSCSFLRIRTDGVFMGITGGTLNANVVDCTFNRDTKRAMNGVYMSPDISGTMNINVNRNNFTTAGGYAVLIQGNGTATYNGRVNNNTIVGPNSCGLCVLGLGTNASCNCFGDGVQVRSLASASGTVEVISNNISGIDDTGRGISIESQVDGHVNAQISSNTISIAGDAFDAIDLLATTPSGFTPTICARVNNNTTTISGVGPQTFTCHFRVRAGGAGSSVNLVTPGATSAQVWDMNANTPLSTTATSNGNPVVFQSATGGGTVTFGACPALPPGHPTALINSTNPWKKYPLLKIEKTGIASIGTDQSTDFSGLNK